MKHTDQVKIILSKIQIAAAWFLVHGARFAMEHAPEGYWRLEFSRLTDHALLWLYRLDSSLGAPPKRSGSVG